MGLQPKNDFYMFFRRSCLRLQDRFCKLMAVNHMPRVFLHGNPHIDNFARITKGEAMIDFDRSRMGPYGWDIVRFLSSLSLRREEPSKKFLSNRVLRDFAEAYLDGFSNPHIRFASPELLKAARPQEWQKSTTDYLKADTGWSKKLRASPLPPTHAIVANFLKLYAASRREMSLLTDYRVSQAGLALGSLGKPRVLVVLDPIRDRKKDKILLDLKEVYADADNRNFFNHFVHHGIRMIEASHLYAPGMEQRLGYFTWKDRQFWGRQVPSFKAKIKGNLSDSKQSDLAVSVGLQLGSAHRRSLRDSSPKEVIRDLKANYDTFIELGATLNEQLQSAWHYHHRFQVDQTVPKTLPPKRLLKRIIEP